MVAEQEKPEAKKPRREMDKAPHALAMTKSVNGTSTKAHLKTLFDTGASCNMLKRSASPKGVKLLKLKKRVKVNTVNGAAKVTECVVIDTMKFPEFSSSGELAAPLVALVFDDKNTRCDLTLG